MNLQEYNCECVFHIYGRIHPAGSDCYRPTHRIDDGLFMSGLHTYYNCDCCYNDSFVLGKVSFLSSEVLDEKLYPGKKVYFYEGERNTGYLVILNTNSDLTESIVNKENRRRLAVYNLPNENNDLLIDGDYQLITITQNNHSFSFYLPRSAELNKMTNAIFARDSLCSEEDVLNNLKDKIVLLYYLAQYHKDYLIDFIDAISEDSELSEAILTLEEANLNFHNKAGESFTLAYYLDKEIREWKNILRRDAYPSYLSNIVKIDEGNDTKVACNIVCGCGNREFAIANNCFDNQSLIHNVIDLLKKEKKSYKNTMIKRDIKAKCSKCGSIYTLFNDSFYQDGKYALAKSNFSENIRFPSKVEKIRLVFYYKNDSERNKEIVYERVDIVGYNTRKIFVYRIYL